jgi:hypothetical protein
LATASSQFDADGNASISKDEIATRLQSWIDHKTSLFVLPVLVTLRGERLPGATVRFIPEKFLGEAFRPAEGITDSFGVANLAHAPEDRPDPEFPYGVRTGLYRVEISKVVNGKELISAEFNSKTILGQEVANGAAGMGQQVTFDVR